MPSQNLQKCADLVPYSKPFPLPHRKPPSAIRRVFDNSQLIERFEKWLLICGKSENTRINYAAAVRQFGQFFDKPLTAASTEDIRAFIANLYAKRMAPSHGDHCVNRHCPSLCTSAKKTIAFNIAHPNTDQQKSYYLASSPNLISAKAMDRID
jgi:hypothetical protein